MDKRLLLITYLNIKLLIIKMKKRYREFCKNSQECSFKIHPKMHNKLLKVLYRKAVFIVTYRMEKNRIFYLILKRKLHWHGWEFPKGGVERFEFKKGAVKRELREETGQSSNNIKKYPIKGKYQYHKILKDRPGYIGQEFGLYSAEIKNKKIIFDKREHSGYKWLSYKQALKKLTWQNQRKCLSIVNDYLIDKH